MVGTGAEAGDDFAIDDFWGTLVTQFERNATPRLSNWRAWVLNFAGVILALYVFMADTLAAVPVGLKAVCDVVPEKFNWPLFCVAWCLMAAPAIQTSRRVFAAPEPGSDTEGMTDNLDARAT